MNHQQINQPPGFSLENYEQVKKYTARDWSTQIHRRVFIDRVIGTTESSTGELKAKYQKHLLRLMPELWLNPAPDSSYPFYAIDLHPSTTSLTRNDLGYLKGAIYNQNPDNTAEPEPSLDEGTTLLDDLLERNNPAVWSGTAHLKVDLYADDKQIVNDLRTWLNQRRQVIEIRIKTPTPEKMEKWCDSHVLPYADLKLWSKYRRSHISEAHITDLLFPYSTVDKPLKSTKANYADAIRPEMYRALSHNE